MVVATMAALAAGTASRGALFVWNNSAGGTYSTASNWTPSGPPTSVDTARFNLANTYTVSFTANQVVSVLDMPAGAVSFTASVSSRSYDISTANLHGGDLSLTGPAFPIGMSVSNGLTINTGSQLTINQGNDADAGSLNLGAVVGGGTGTLLVDGLASTFAVTGASLVGASGGTGVMTFQNSATGNFNTIELANSATAGNTATLLVQSGADVTASGNVLFGPGNLAGQSTTVTVTGSGSTFVQSSGSMTVGGGANSSANVTVSASAIFNSGSGTLTINPTGVVNISGGTLNAFGDVTINGGRINGTSGAFSWAVGNTLNIQAGGRFSTPGNFTAPFNAVINVTGGNSQFDGSGSTLNISGGGQLNVTNGGQVGPFSSISAGLGTVGTIVVDGTDSSFSASGINQIGASGGTGTLTFRNNAESFGGGLRVGQGANLSSGTVNVQSGAHLQPASLEIGSTGHAGAVGIVNVQDPGSLMWVSGGFGSGSVTIGADSGSVGTLNVSGGATLNTGTNSGSCVSAATGSGSFTLNPTGTLNVTGGRAAIGTLNQQGGTLNFSSGALGYKGSLTVGAGGLFGTNLTLSSNRALALTDVTTVLVGSTLTLNGGELGTGSLEVNGTFNFNSGALGICGTDGLTIGRFEVFGENLSVGAGKSIYVGNTTTVEAGSTLTIDGGSYRSGLLSNSGNVIVANGELNVSFSTFTNNAAGRLFIDRNQEASVDGPLNNSGRIELGGGAAHLDGSNTLTNTGVLLGGGEVAKNLTNAAGGEVRADSGERLLISGVNGVNAGAINAYGGTLEITNAFTNSGQINLIGGTMKFGGLLTNSATGVITGRGTLSFSQCVNNGQMQLSAGLTDVFGAVTGNSGSKVIVSGGATATFYNNVTMNSGSEFRVSTASRAVFFGSVSGSNFFTGSGTKDFEAGSSILGPVSTAGSTVVEAPASVTANHFREDSLTVNGLVTISTSGGTSHLNHLAISGGTDAWDGVLDLKNNSLVLEAGDLAVITDQIRSGLNAGTGITSSAPGAPFRLGSMSNAGPVYTSFQGIGGLDGDEVLIRYTRIGDLNLDGTVTISDFIDLASHFNTVGGATWQMGDVNYDGVVSISDFIDLASNFNQSVSGVAGPIGEAEGAMLAGFAEGNGVSAVPEPGWILGMGMAGGILGLRRRRVRFAGGGMTNDQGPMTKE
jgi:hypothetical protein